AIVLTHLGQTLVAMSKVSEGIGCLEKARQTNPNDLETLIHLAAALKILGRLDDSVACYQEALRLQPDFAQLYLNLGDAFRVCGKLKMHLQPIKLLCGAGLSSPGRTTAWPRFMKPSAS